MRSDIIINRIFLTLSIIALLFTVCSCQTNLNSFENLSKDDEHNIKYKGHYKVGCKYKIKGKSYYPRKYRKYSKIGKASWYGHKDGTQGKKTANGDIYNKELLTAAHKTLHMPSLVRVRNLENGKSLIVMVNDRGPYVKGREIDVSEKAAKILGFRKKGVAKVKIEYMPLETKKLLNFLGLTEKEGCTSKKPLPNKKCSVNCYIKLINLKYRYNISS